MQTDDKPLRTFVLADLYFGVTVRNAFRNWKAGGDASQWQYDPATDDMRRFIYGHWQTREATPTEREIGRTAYDQACAW